MKHFYLIVCFLFGFSIAAQSVAFEEYDLSNGLHVILHQDNSAPVVTVNVMYHVGSKDESPQRTGFAHFFEHLLFEGTKNIERGKWFSLVSENGGSNNAFTTFDFTNYFETFPSNNLELGLWMEAERMLHPVINTIGVETQNEVVKEEKRMRFDNQPYGRILPAIQNALFSKHPYRWPIIGSMEHLDAATLDEFKAFNQKFYVPNNAVLVVAGDFEPDQAKQWIDKYFGHIPKGKEIVKETYVKAPIQKTIEKTVYDPNIQLPAVILAYRTPAAIHRDSKSLELLSSYLSKGKSSVLCKKLVEDKKMALQVEAGNLVLEDYSFYFVFALLAGDTTAEDMLAAIDEEISQLQKELISERNLEKLQNKMETDYIGSNSSVQEIAIQLASYYTVEKDANRINQTLEVSKSISREELRTVAQTYLNPNQRAVIQYLPESKE